MKTAAIAIAVILALVASASNASACIMTHMEPSPRAIAAATIVFRGKIVQFTKINKQFGKLRFEMIDTFRGEKRPEWTLIWFNYSFGMADTIKTFRARLGDETLVAALPAATSAPGSSIPFSIAGQPKPQKYAPSLG